MAKEQQQQQQQQQQRNTVVVDVTITSDLICPWCYVGLRHLEQAAKNTNIKPIIAWKPYMLRSYIPEEGQPKGGTPASRVGTHLSKAGKRVGINFTGLTDRTPNTLLFHAVMSMLQEDDPNVTTREMVTAYQVAAFDAYYTYGVFPDKDGLLKAAAEYMNKKIVDDHSVKIIHDKIQALFDDKDQLQKYREKAMKEVTEAQAARVSGVPTFTIGGVVAFSGAQPVPIFEEWLQEHSYET